jgi:hypothetical protein
MAIERYSAPWVQRAAHETEVSVRLTIRTVWQNTCRGCDLLGAHRWRWSPGTAKSCAHVELNLAVNRTILGDLIL